MDKMNKFIKFGSLAAFILMVLAVGYGLSRIAPVEVASKIRRLLPFNRDKAVEKTAAGEPIRMLFFGDLMLDRHVSERIKEKGLDYLFSGLAESGLDLSQYNLVSANLEGAVTDNGAHYPPELPYDFAFAPDVIDQLKKCNFTAFNLANNHLEDQGQTGVKETMANLARLGFNYYGCGDGQTGDCSVSLYETHGLKIGLAGFSLVYKRFNPAGARKVIEELKSRSDLVVANLHWGTEYAHDFNETQSGVARELIDAGADIIIGHHPHVVEGVETYKGKLIFYSLGNFIFDQYFSADTQEELAVEISRSADGRLAISLMPVMSVNSRPVLMAGAAREKYLEKIAGWSVGTDELKQQIKNGEIIY